MKRSLHLTGALLMMVAAVLLLAACASSQSSQPMLGQRAGSYMDDSWITTAIKTKLIGDAGLKSFHVHVVTQNRVVTLSGVLPSQALCDEAVRVAKSVDGVVKVVSALQVKAPQD